VVVAEAGTRSLGRLILSARGVVETGAVNVTARRLTDVSVGAFLASVVL
jgi:hypothetical protein